MRHIAIIGSGPAGYYTAEAAQKLWGEDVRVEGIAVRHAVFGLVVDRSIHVTLRGNDIEGTGEAALGLRGRWNGGAHESGNRHDRPQDGT